MDEQKMALAWEAFEKAASFEAKAQDNTKSDPLRATALRACDRKLDEAVRLEAEALGEELPKAA